MKLNKTERNLLFDILTKEYNRIDILNFDDYSVLKKLSKNKRAMVWTMIMRLQTESRKLNKLESIGHNLEIH